MQDKTCLTGKVYAEIIHIGDTDYEHIGFRDELGVFGDVLAQYIGKKIQICIEVIHDGKSPQD